jgi:hypothetical protein
VISVNDFKNKLDEINSIMQTLGQTSLNSDKMNAIAVSNPDDRNSRAFQMANLSEDASIKDMKSVVGSGGNMKVESEELGTTTFNKEAADIEAKSAQNAKDLAAAKG